VVHGGGAAGQLVLACWLRVLAHPAGGSEPPGICGSKRSRRPVAAKIALAMADATAIKCHQER
jgi:hypothetical protein